jgi:hypothetical protein
VRSAGHAAASLVPDHGTVGNQGRVARSLPIPLALGGEHGNGQPAFGALELPGGDGLRVFGRDEVQGGGAKLHTKRIGPVADGLERSAGFVCLTWGNRPTMVVWCRPSVLS